MEIEITTEKQLLELGLPDAERKGASCPHAPRRDKGDLAFAALTILLVAAAWVIGFNWQNADIEPFLHQAMPTADRIETFTAGSYAGYQADQLLGYIFIGKGNGYGGPMNLAVASDLQGDITGLAVVRHSETPSWFKRVRENGFLSQLIGKKYSDAFDITSDVDGISGATYTSRGIAEAAKQGSRFLAENNLNFPVIREAPAKIEFGPPELALLVLFALGLMGHRKNLRHRKQLRWFSMLAGMVALGFVYTNPLTISMINKLLLGFWPDWHTQLYWYLFVGGILFALAALGKNPYCQWFCPFGAAQECLGVIGGAKAYSLSRFKTPLKWLQRGLFLVAIIIALLYRNTGISSYEVFGTLFDLKGSISQFFLLGLVILASIFVRRPWCRYLCPLKPFESFVKTLRKQVKAIWQN